MTKTEDHIEHFYKEQLSAQRGMLTSAIDALVKKKENLEDSLQKVRNRNNELALITYHLFHSVRGPMTTLMGILELMKLESDSDSTHMLVKTAEKTIKGLDDFSVDLAKKVELLLNKHKLEEVDVREMIFSEIKTIEKNHKVDDIDFQLLNKCPNEGLIMVERPILRDLLHSMLKNSVQSFEKGQKNKFIKVQFKTKNNFTVFLIADNGCGMSPNVKEKATDMFFKGSKKKGNGIGLYFAKILLEERKMPLKIMSKEGKGTRVAFTLTNS